MNPGRWALSAQRRRSADLEARHRRGSFRRAVAAFLLFAGVLAVASVSAAEPRSVAAGPVAPTQWPSSFLAAPQIEGWPNALRIFGGDRYQTSLASALVMRGQGDFPFETSDPSSGGVRSLSQANGWWGLGVCPKAIIVTAGDSPADALAAAALSDSTGHSTEPYLRRSSAADPLFDPPGGFARVDTFAAPILLTPSARSGASALAVPVRLAAQDLRSGGCNTARQAIIVGGPAAVAPQVEAELVSIGYAEVFRVSGATRFGTAAAVASALGTAPVPSGASGCADPSAADGTATMGFWANSVVEWRESPEECRLLGRTVVLTDGIDGVDAIAAGWWTSFWQVPVLLHDGSDELPTETATALSLLEVDNIIVVGGLERLSQPAVRAAARLARANTIRVSGSDRYATSVAMAERLGGWWPTGSGHDFASSMLCVVASSGSGRGARGWADALGAGPWCGAATGAAVGAPPRMLPPVNVAQPAVVTAAGLAAAGTDGAGAAKTGEQVRHRPTRDAVPVLLVPAGADRLPDSVAAFLLDAFAASELCESQADPVAYAKALANGVCPMPGFAVAFGGDSVITPGLLGELSAALGGNMTSSQPNEPVLIGAQTPDPFSPYGVQATPGVEFGVGSFATSLSMAPVFHYDDGDGVQMCMPRGTFADARWLVAETNGTAAAVEVPQKGWYLADADGVARSVGKGAPACVDVGETGTLAAPLLARSVGPSGVASDSLMLVADASRHFALTGPISANEPSSIGTPSEVDPPEGGHTRWLFQTGAVTDRAMLGNRAESIVDTRIVLHLYRGTAVASASSPSAVPDTFTANWHIRTERGTLIGTAHGEALLSAGVWHLRGAAVLTMGTWASAVYGPPSPAISDEGPPPIRGAGTPFDPLRVGTSDAYGAGGFSATLTVNSAGTADDILSWRPEAYINTLTAP